MTTELTAQRVAELVEFGEADAYGDLFRHAPSDLGLTVVRSGGAVLLIAPLLPDHPASTGALTLPRPLIRVIGHRRACLMKVTAGQRLCYTPVHKACRRSVLLFASGVSHTRRGAP